MQPIQSTPSFLPMPVEGIAPVPAEQQKVQLKAQVEEFASLLYAQMFSEMREAGKGEEEDGNSVFGGGDTSMFMHFMDEKVSRDFIKQGGGGLNDALYKQLSQRLDGPAPGGGK